MTPLDDLRIEKADRWWSFANVRRKLEIARFEDYLATIPEIPSQPKELNRPVLVEGRLSLSFLCNYVADIRFSGDDRTFVPSDPARAKSSVRWMWCRDGRQNQSREPYVDHGMFPAGEVGLDAIEGVAVYLDDPIVASDIRHGDYYMNLLGSVLSDHRDRRIYPCIGDWGDGSELNWFWGGYNTGSKCGFASREECAAIPRSSQRGVFHGSPI